MNLEVDAFFTKRPQAKSLYMAFADVVQEKFPDVEIKVQKTQIAFTAKHQFAFVWLPVRRMKSRPDVYIIVSFGPPYRLDSPRIAEATEPYPNRWTHHIIIKDDAEIDQELMDWLDEAHTFAVSK